MVGLGRFELPTNGLGNRCSIHLSYSPEAGALPILYVSGTAEENIRRCAKFKTVHKCPTSIVRKEGANCIWLL